MKPLRPKTQLLYNNENLCTSNHPRGTSYNKWSILIPDGEPTQTSIVILVLSCRKNFLQRNLIRQTYGAIRNLNNVHILAVVFMLGGVDAPDAEITDISKLEAERVQFDDMIMGDFVDTYRNLTRKSIMAYDWLTSFCQDADLLVKTDDDVMLNIFKLTEELGKWTPTVFRSYNIWCAIHWTEQVNKDEKSMYYISPEQYPGDILPKHCGGVGYVTTMDTVKRIKDEISRSFQGIVCTHEDVFMTGIVPEKINLADAKHVELIDRMAEWILYVFDSNEHEDAKYILKVLKQPANETVDFDEFRKRSGTRIFFLINHGPEFEELYMRLWQLMKNAFRNERLTIKIEIIQ